MLKYNGLFPREKMWATAKTRTKAKQVPFEDDKAKKSTTKDKDEIPLRG
jgi:hypothetical protein